MSDAECHHWPLTIGHPNLGPGWWTIWQREGEDARTMDDIVIQDCYHLRGLDAADWEGRPVLDIGANVGGFAATCVAMGSRRVICVEPEADNLALLDRNVGESPYVEILPAAVGATRGRCRVIGESGAAHTEPGDEVDVMIVADLLDLYGPLSILKVDIEGAEYDALLACPPERFAAVDRILIEYHGPNMQGPGTCPWIVPRVGALVEHLLHTHSVSAFGVPEDGGMMFTHRHDL